MAKLSKQIDKIPFAPVVAIAFGVVSAALVFAVPDWRFSQAVTASGLPEILSAARPPLGDTARALVAIAVGTAVGAVLWIGLSLLGAVVKARKPKRVKAKGARIDPVITAPAPPHRRPIFAEADLGAPFMSDEIIANVPTVPAEPDELILDTAWVEPVAEHAPVEVRAPVSDPALVAPSPEFAAPEREPSVGDLLARLETALARRPHRSARAGDIASLRQALTSL